MAWDVHPSGGGALPKPGDERPWLDPDGSCMSPARTLRTLLPMIVLGAFLAFGPTASAASKLRLTFKAGAVTSKTGVLSGTLT